MRSVGGSAIGMALGNSVPDTGILRIHAEVRLEGRQGKANLEDGSRFNSVLLGWFPVSRRDVGGRGRKGRGIYIHMR